MATLSPAALGQVLDYPTAASKWEALSRVYASSMQARLIHLKYELQHVKKGDLTIAAFLEKAKQLADNLAAAGKPIPPDDLVFYILGGLPTEFEPLVMYVTSRAEPITVEELNTMLLTQEHRLALTTLMASMDLSPTPAANIAARQPSHGGRGGHRGRGQGRGRGRGRGNFQGSNTSHQGGNHNNSGSSDSRPQCQLSERRGHTGHL